MQPYFFPYLGYFSLIKHTDRFILLDTVQFIRHGWIERNRILKQGEGWLYIKVPIIKNNGRETLIKDVTIDNQQRWKQKILAQLQEYKKIGINYSKVIEMVTDLFNNDYDSITSLNKSVLECVCNYIGIKNRIEIFSEMNINIENPQSPDEWALNICKALGGVDEYWNPPGGLSFFNKSKFSESGINLKFQKVNLEKYNQKRIRFEEGLSIIDVMMFNNNSRILEMLDNFQLL